MQEQIKLDSIWEPPPERFQAVLEGLNKDGFFFGEMNNKDYQNSPGVSSTDLRRFFKQGAFAYRQGKQYPMPRKAALEYGDMVHKVLLEGWDVLSDFKFMEGLREKSPKATRNNAGYKEYKKTLLEKRKTYLVDRETYLAIKGWVECCKHDKNIKELFAKENLKEYALFSIDKTTGLVLKCKPDILGFGEKGTYIADIKTMTGAMGNTWSKSVEKLGYNIQAVHYMETFNQAEGLTESQKACVFPFLCFSKERPYSVGLKTLCTEHLLIGEGIWRETLQKIRGSYRSNQWGNILNEEIEESGITMWYAQEHERFMPPVGGY